MVTPDILRQYRLAVFDGSGQNSIQAIAADSRGDVYVAGTTSSPDFLTKNAAQPRLGDARILRTGDLGTSWTPVGSPPQDVNVVVADPVTPQVLFAGGDKGIYKSGDGGVSWRLVYGFSSGYAFGGALAIDPGNHQRVAAVEPFSGTLVRSLDGGEHWSSGGAPCRISNCQGQLTADPTGSGALIVSSFGLSLSLDWGLTFQALTPPGFGSPSVAAFVPSRRGWIYAGTAAGVSGSLALTTDFGVTWVSKAAPPNTFSAILNLAVDPDDPNRLVAGTPDALYTSSDGAATWTREASNGGAFLPQAHLAFGILSSRCATGGGLFALGSASAGSYGVAYSPDYGATWQTPRLSGVTSVTVGPGCAAYITRNLSSDAFVAKVSADGTLLWATFLGGSDMDAAVGLAVDRQDNVYVAGNTSSPDFPTTVPRIGVAGQSAAFLTRLSPAGGVVYSAVVSGEGRNSAMAVAVDLNGNGYVAGGTNSIAISGDSRNAPGDACGGSVHGISLQNIERRFAGVCDISGRGIHVCRRDVGGCRRAGDARRHGAHAARPACDGLHLPDEVGSRRVADRQRHRAAPSGESHGFGGGRRRESIGRRQGRSRPRICYAGRVPGATTLIRVHREVSGG